MKKLKLSALVLAFTLSTVSAFSCADNTSESNSVQQVAVIEDNTETTSKIPNQYSNDSKKTNSSFGEEAEVNDTVFTLNNVVIVESPTDDGNEYVYINVTIKNNTDIEYEISSLNNFYIALPDETELLSNVRAKLYAINNYTKCVDDYITIPANGEFTGYLAGGFILPEGTNSFSVGFFPTLSNMVDRANVIVSTVNAGNVSYDDSVLK